MEACHYVMFIYAGAEACHYVIGVFAGAETCHYAFVYFCRRGGLPLRVVSFCRRGGLPLRGRAARPVLLLHLKGKQKKMLDIICRIFRRDIALPDGIRQGRDRLHDAHRQDPHRKSDGRTLAESHRKYAPRPSELQQL